MNATTTGKPHEPQTNNQTTKWNKCFSEVVMWLNDIHFFRLRRHVSKWPGQVVRKMRKLLARTTSNKKNSVQTEQRHGTACK